MQSMGQTQAVPVEIVSDDPNYDFEACDGNTRKISAEEFNINVLKVEVRTPFANDNDRHWFATVCNYNSHQLIPMDFSNALKRQADAGRRQEELAAGVGKNQMTISNYLSLQKLHPQIQKMLHPETPKRDQISPNTGFLLAKVSESQQLTVYNKAKEGGGRITAERVKLIIEGMGIEVQIRKRNQNPVHKRRKVERTLRAVGGQFRELQKSEQEHIKGYIEGLDDDAWEDLAEKIETAANELSRIKLIAGMAGLDVREEIKTVGVTGREDHDEKDLSKHRDPTLPKRFLLETFIIVHRINSAKSY
jgi:hypothetical protein